MSLSVAVQPGASVVWLEGGRDISDCVFRARLTVEPRNDETGGVTRSGLVLFNTGLLRRFEEEVEGVRFWLEQCGSSRRYFLAGANLTSPAYSSPSFEVSEPQTDEIEISLRGRNGVARVRGLNVAVHFSAHLFEGRIGIFNASTSPDEVFFSDVRLEPLPKPLRFPKGERRRPKVPRRVESSNEEEIRETMALIARLGKTYNAACEGEEQSSILEDRTRILEWIENLHRKLRDLKTMNNSQYFCCFST